MISVYCFLMESEAMAYETVFEEVRILFPAVYQYDCSAFTHWPWITDDGQVAQKASAPLLRREIDYTLRAGQLIPPQYADGFEPSSREVEIQRIAWLVASWDDNKAHVEFYPFSGVVDGHHTLAAATYLERPIYFDCPTCGREDLARLPPVLDSSFRNDLWAQGKNILAKDGIYYLWDFQQQAIYLYRIEDAMDDQTPLGNCKFSGMAPIYIYGKKLLPCEGDCDERIRLFLSALADTGGPDFRDITEAILHRVKEEGCGGGLSPFSKPYAPAC